MQITCNFVTYAFQSYFSVTLSVRILPEDNNTTLHVIKHLP